MRTGLLAAAMIVGFVGTAEAQAPFKIYTSPKLPPRDSLERMNLTAAWTTRVSVDGSRDGIASLQLIPGTPTQVVVQTFKGSVYLFDANNGDLVWKTDVGVPYWSVQAAAFSSHSIYVTRRNMLHVLNRQDGTQRVFTYDRAIKQFSFGHELAFAPQATPVADEDFLYVPMADRVHSILIPDFAELDRIKRVRDARKFGAKEEKKGGPKDKGVIPEDDPAEGLDSPQPEFYWGFKLGDKIMTSSPLIFGEQLSMLSNDGTLTSIKRYERGGRIENFEFKTTGQAPAAAGQHLHMAFIASDDFNLYAVNMKSGLITWRHVSGSPIRQQPYANDRDVYVAPDRVGLRRLDRETGRERWTNRDATRFLAANLKNVYALDNIGKFFVLDAERGTTLAKLDLADWTITLPNEWTDRIYLGAHDGQILCLRHRDLLRPLALKVSDVAPPKMKEEKKRPPMEEKKKDEEKKGDKGAEKAASDAARWTLDVRFANLAAPAPAHEQVVSAPTARRRPWAVP
ncbi:MAG: PQQ-binding-like beta-propeller repeat protein [Planctomycetes bacterium]|nr:PQQ-binding-like beta-propeller repeat protein [Planctomycetota bacterium]